MKNEFGNNLKKIRICNNMSQKELADILNVSYKTISHWENGYSEPDFELLIKIKNYFQVEYSDLLE